MLHYRIEDTEKYASTSSPNNASTCWVDINSFAGTITASDTTSSLSDTIGSINSSNFYIDKIAGNDIIRPTAAKKMEVVGNDLRITTAGILYTTNRPYFIYFRVGLPMLNNYSFTHSSMYMINNTYPLTNPPS